MANLPAQKEIFVFAGIGLTIAMAVAAFASPAGAWPLCVGAISCFAFSNIDKIKELSGSTQGFKLLTNIREEIGELRRVAKLSAGVGMGLVQRAGRTGTFSYDEKEAFLSEARQLLLAAKFTEAEISELQDQYWDRFVMFDYVLAITGGTTIPGNHDHGLLSEWRRLRDFKNIPTPDAVETVIRKYDALEGLRSELLEEYRYYFQHRKHRRPEIWNRRDEIKPIPGPKTT